MNRDELNDLLAKIAGIFLWCLILSVILLFVWFVFYWFAGDWVFRLHTTWFELSKHEFDLINYCGMGLVKIYIILFFLFPYLAIKLVLRKKK